MKKDPQEVADVKDEESVKKGQSAMMNAMEAQTKVLLALQTQMNDLKSENQQMNTVHRAAVRTLGEERWMTKMRDFIKGGPRQLVKEVLKTPFRILNIIILTPAWNGFNILFGNYAYKIWSMLILVLLVLVSSGIVLKTNFPLIYSSIMSTVSYLWESALYFGSIVALQLERLIGDAGMIALRQGWQALQELWSVIRSYINQMTLIRKFASTMWEAAPSANPMKWWSFDSNGNRVMKNKKKKRRKKKIVKQ